MSSHTNLPEGSLTAKRRRLPDGETRRRMLDTATTLIAETGLTVSLEHLSYEAVIQEAQVSRTAAYRIWRTKEGFFEDVLCELASAQWQGTAAFDDWTLLKALEVFVEHIDDLDSEEGRRRVWTEAARIGAQRNFESLAEHKHWRTYVALTATVMSMPDSKLRRRIETALCESETKALAYMAEFYREMTASIGYRLRPQFNGDYMMMSAVGAAVIEGLGLRRIIAPRAVEQEFKFHGFGSPDIQNWSVASIGFTAIMFALIEPDPDFDEAILPTLKERLLAKKQEVEERLATDPQPMWARAED